MLRVLLEFLWFLRMRRKAWMIPLLLVVGVLSLLVKAGEVAVLQPFIYALF